VLISCVNKISLLLFTGIFLSSCSTIPPKTERESFTGRILILQETNNDKRVGRARFEWRKTIEKGIIFQTLTISDLWGNEFLSAKNPLFTKNQEWEYSLPDNAYIPPQQITKKIYQFLKFQLTEESLTEILDEISLIFERYDESPFANSRKKKIDFTQKFKNTKVSLKLIID
jgi:hypothetical protein